MNTAEKIAATYLRLNGFMLLPHFTIFGGETHCHVDFIGLRAANSVEIVGNRALPIDEDFFRTVAYMLPSPRKKYLGAVAEVRTNKDSVSIRADRIKYIRSFFGKTRIASIRFYETDTGPRLEDKDICIGVPYALHWIVNRINWMKEHLPGLTKDGSWTWSEESLSDFLVIYKYGFLRSNQSVKDSLRQRCAQRA